MKHTNREYVDLMTNNHPERVWFTELFGPLVGLEDEWKRQGATNTMLDMTAFGFDYVPHHYIGNPNAIHTFPTRVLEDDGIHYKALDHFGRIVKMDRRTSTIPLPETFPVQTMDDWLKIRYMFEYDESRVTDEEIDAAIERQKHGTVEIASFPGGFDILRELMGDVGCCIAFYEDPELVHAILDTVSDTAARVNERIAEKMTVDQVSIHEDMAGKSGPIIGPNLVREFLVPYYRKCLEPSLASGTKIVCQDSDGDMFPVIDAFTEAGVNLFYPCEPVGNMDIVKLRQKYGHKIMLRGGLDKHVLRKSREDIDRELAYKLAPAMCDGGIIFALDHRIPNGTPLENYIYYVDRAREILGLGDFRSAEPGWSRMAF